MATETKEVELKKCIKCKGEFLPAQMAWARISSCPPCAEDKIREENGRGIKVTEKEAEFLFERLDHYRSILREHGIETDPV